MEMWKKGEEKEKCNRKGERRGERGIKDREYYGERKIRVEM